MSNGEPQGVGYRVLPFRASTDRNVALLDTDQIELLAPAAGTVRVVVENEPGLAEVEIDLEMRDRSYDIVELRARPGPGESLRLELLRSLPIHRWLRPALAGSVLAILPDGTRFTADEPIVHPDPMHHVATVYSTALALGQNPTAQVAIALGIDNDAAAQRVYRVRKKGLLPATKAGRKA